MIQVGNLVRNVQEPEMGIGIVTSCSATVSRAVIVFWNLSFPEELEYIDQLDVISESR